MPMIYWCSWSWPRIRSLFVFWE